MIVAAELQARIAVKGVPEANRKLMAFHSNLKKVSGEDATGSLQAEVDESGFTDFATMMVDAKNQEATASLKANVDSTGFEEFKALMTDAKLSAAKPIVQEAKLKYERGAFSSLRREIFLTKEAMGGLGGDGNLGSALGGALMPFGKIGTLALAASGPVLDLAGGLTAVGGSAVGAAEGLGAVGIAAGGVAAVGIGGIVAVAIPAVMSLKALTEAQKGYVAAVETYGVQSTQAETAAKKLQAAERSSGKEAVGLVRNLDSVKERWSDLTKPGREAFLGGLSDAIDRVDKKLPMLANSANRSAQVGRKGFDSFLSQVTGSDFEKFVHTMTNTEENILPQLSHATGDWGQVLERVATDAAPSLERVVGTLAHWSKEVLGSTNNSHKLEGEISHLTTDFMDWVHLLTASGSLLHDIFDAGEGSGNELVVDTTHQFEEWGAWIDSHGPQVEAFFTQTKEGVEVLASILGHIGQDWFVMSKAMEPVETGALKILDAFAQIHIGGQSMLTYLLGGFAALKVAIAAVKIKDLFEGLGWLKALAGSSAAETTDIDRLIAALQGQADAAGAAAAANADLAASNEAVSASMQTSMLETGALPAAEKAGQLSMFPMGGGVTKEATVGAPVIPAVESEAAGAAGAKGIATGLKSALPLAIGAIGIGNIVTSATHKDWQDAGAEAGGAIVGGIGGFMLGGPVGAAIGVGIGSVAGEIVSGLFGSGKTLAPLQKALIAESHHAAAAMHAQRDAAQGLAKAEGSLAQSEDHHKKSTVATRKAHQDLNAAVKQFGPDSMQAHQAEIKLSDAQHRDAVTANEVQAAYKLTANERQRDRLSIVEQIAANKQLIPNLKTVIAQLTEQHNAHEHNLPVLEKLTAKEKQLAEVIATLGRDYQQAERVGPKKWVRSLESMTNVQAQFGHSLHGLLAQIPEFGTVSASSTAKADRVWTDAKGAIHTSTGNAAADVKSMAQTTKIQVVGMDEKVGEVLQSFGVQKANFAGKESPPQKKQQGGFIVPGSGSGDRPGFTGEAGAFVLNREATHAYGFATGGSVPLALEPGERYFSKPEVQKIGAHNLAAMNSSVQRFQKGGALGPEPVIGGPTGELRSLGQSAIHAVYKGGAEYLAKHKPQAPTMSTGGGEYTGKTPPGVGSFDGFPVDKWIIPELEYARAHGWSGPITSGYRTPAHSAELGYPNDEHTKTSYPGGAVDFGGMHEAAALANRAAFIAATKGYKGPKLQLPIGFVDDGHMSGTGHQRGGLVQALAEGGFVGGGYTIKGAKPSAEQMRVATEIGKANDATSAPYEAQVAIYMAATQENDMTGSNTFELTGPFNGVTPGSSTYDQAVEWQTKGYYVGPNLGAGGGIAKSKKSSDPGLVAQEVEGSAYPTLYEQWKGEGQKWASGWHGGTAGHPTKAEEVAGTYKETVPKVFEHCKTDPLSIASGTPKSMHGIQREIALRKGELRKHQHAVAVAVQQHKPAVAQKLEANVTALQTRLDQLRKAASKLRRQIAEAKFGHRLGRQFGRVTGFGQSIEEASADYTTKNEYAEHVVDLEPVAPEFGELEPLAQTWHEQQYDETLRAYISGKEQPAYQAVLGSEANWRNTILEGEEQASGFEKNQEFRIRLVQQQIAYTNNFTKKVQKDIEAWKAEPAKKGEKKTLPKWIEVEEITRDDLRNQLPSLRFEETERLKVLGGARAEFYGDKGNPLVPPLTPRPYSGTFEGNLGEVQGTQHWPGQRQKAASLPSTRNPSTYGGVIWSTQEQMEQLALELAGAVPTLPSSETGTFGGGEGFGGSGAENPLALEKLERENELLKQANERSAITAALTPTLAQFNASYPVGMPYMGAFEKGGVAMVGERGPELAHLPSGTRIHNAADTERMVRGNQTVVIKKLEVHPDRVHVEMEDDKVVAIVHEVIRSGQSSPGIPTPGGGMGRIR